MKITAVIRYKHGELWKALKTVGWTQAELARRVGMHQSLIGLIFNLRKRPSEAQADKIQAAFAEANCYLDVLGAWPSSFKLTGNQEITAEVPAERLLIQNTILALTEGELNEPFFDKEDLDGLEEALESLTPDEAQVISLRFGLNGADLTCAEVARKLDRWPSDIQRIEAKGLRKLRHPAQMKKFIGAWPKLHTALKEHGYAYVSPTTALELLNPQREMA